MKRLVCVMLFLLLLSSCGQSTSPLQEVLDETVSIKAKPSEPEQAMSETTTNVYIQEDDVTVGLEQYTIRRIGADSTYFFDRPILDTVEVYRNGDFSAPTQIFQDFTYDSEAPVNGEFIVEDLNFDGWPDFRIFAYQSRIGSGWFYWCWNPDTEEFVLQQEMENILTPVVNQAEQTIYSSELYGLGGFSFSTFRWEDGTLVETQCFSVVWDGDRLVNRWYIRRDGVLHIEKEWYVGDWKEYGDSLVVPEAETYLDSVRPKL